MIYIYIYDTFMIKIVYSIIKRSFNLRKFLTAMDRQLISIGSIMRIKVLQIKQVYFYLFKFNYGNTGKRC